MRYSYAGYSTDEAAQLETVKKFVVEIARMNPNMAARRITDLANQNPTEKLHNIMKSFVILADVDTASD